MTELIKRVALCFSNVQIIVLSGAVLTIVCIGEKNFFSPQVRYQTELWPLLVSTICTRDLNHLICCKGQWTPLAGTGLAILGSLYLLLAAEVAALKKKEAAKDWRKEDARKPTRQTVGQVDQSTAMSMEVHHSLRVRQTRANPWVWYRTILWSLLVRSLNPVLATHDLN